MRKPFMAGNWKMNKCTAEVKEYAEAFIAACNASTFAREYAEVSLCVPYLQILPMKEAYKETIVQIGAQNMHYEDEGAFTGEVSPKMLAEIGVNVCIIGHSERRQFFNENDADCNKKIKKAHEYGIRPIYCVGEELSQREAGRATGVVSRQLKGGLEGLTEDEIRKTVIAYEPVWAIGTGKTATASQAQEMAAFIRNEIRALAGDAADDVIIQYGGSVKPENAGEFMAMEDIDGALVGGASLDPAGFIKILESTVK